ncbi:unnamed protein product [Lupinus luteus]|uniref:Protein kinase domain-containing protein n=1 Tax=Lupinus luteus TaxID=3873 RepID=A0AAV1X7P1_LUPLU
MKNLQWFKKNSIKGKPRGRRISLGEYKRAVSWSKYLVSPGAAIKGEGEGEWSADMSQLFIGSKFASGRHGRIYRGVYKQRDVEIKLISEQEDEDLAVFLEKQFTYEVSLLLHLHHPNIITFIGPAAKKMVQPVCFRHVRRASMARFIENRKERLENIENRKERLSLEGFITENL